MEPMRCLAHLSSVHIFLTRDRYLFSHTPNKSHDALIITSESCHGFTSIQNCTRDFCLLTFYHIQSIPYNSHILLSYKFFKPANFFKVGIEWLLIIEPNTLYFTSIMILPQSKIQYKEKKKKSILRSGQDNNHMHYPDVYRIGSWLRKP